MDEEVVVAEVTPASEQVATAAPETEVTTPEAAKTFSQEDLDAAIGKRLAREQRKWERERQVVAPPPPAQDARTKYDDFQQVAYNPALRITDVMAQAIQFSDQGPDVAYYLGQNPKEADRISRLTPLVQAKEIGKLEAKLASDPIVKKTSSAPAPIAPVKAPSSGSPTYDTTDPRSMKMSTSDWIAADRKRQIKNAEARLR